MLRWSWYGFVLQKLALLLSHYCVFLTSATLICRFSWAFSFTSIILLIALIEASHFKQLKAAVWSMLTCSIIQTAIICNAMVELAKRVDVRKKNFVNKCMTLTANACSLNSQLIRNNVIL
jgi:integral membrane sensor domain MASE1